MFEHVLGIVMLVIALQFLKAYFPIVSTFDGNVISVAFWTECIAKSPIVLTELGSFTLSQSGADTLLEIDTDGTTGSTPFRTAAILQNVAKSSLVAANLDGFTPSGT